MNALNVAALPHSVDVLEWVRRSQASGQPKPLLNFEQFCDGPFLIRLFDGPTPKTRRDFHINSAAEFFFQLKGELTTVVYKDGEFVTEVCREGQMYWIPPLVPHLNHRLQGSIGLVIHGERKPGALDAMVWYCESCHAPVQRMDYAFEKDLRALLGPKIRAFQASEELRTCKACGSVFTDELGFD